MLMSTAVLDRLTAAPSGIAEFHCWFGHQKSELRQMHGLPPEPFPENEPETAVDRCIDLHHEMGYTNLIWACGRSTVLYKSDLPNTTYSGQLPNSDPDKPAVIIPKVLARCCPLRRTLERCVDLNMIVWGRLGMNRHYGTKGWEAATSQFSLDHPDYHEISRTGETVSSRLCYAISEVQQERIDILLEIQRIGVAGILLDYCRQMPMVGYHPAVFEPFIKQTGQDPRKIDSTDPADHETWFQYRANILTGFMRTLRAAVRQQEEQLGRPCPIIARVPDSPRWLSLGYGYDLEAWAREDLIDGTMLSPFPHTREAMTFDTNYHANTMHDHDKLCIGGIGSKRMMEHDTSLQPQRVQKAYNLAHDQYQAGVDGMSVYQSETLLRLPYLKAFLGSVNDRALVSQNAAAPFTREPDNAACDWHSAKDGIPAFGEHTSAL